MKKVTTLFIFFVSLQLSGQIDSHYWTHQYGAKGLLLNGAVIASSEDETNIFYNPGAMGMDDNLGFAFSFLSPTYAQLQAENFLGDNSNIKDSGIGFSPGFLAVRWQPFKNKKITLGLASFERLKSDIKFENRVTDNINSNEFLVLRADLDFKRKISEDWFGIGLSYNISENFGIGITQFSTWHSQHLDVNLIKEVYASLNPQDVLASWRSEFSYDISTNSGWITKLGLSYKVDSIRVGATFTTATYGISRSGAKYSIDDQRFLKETNTNTVVSNREETELNAFKTPFSIGLGFEYLIDDTKIYFSTEYFSGIPEYTFFSELDDSFDGSAQGESNAYVEVKSQKLSVLNFAIGLQYFHSERLTWLGGFRTDFNQSTSLLLNNNAEYLGSAPDIFHISGGARVDYGKNVFSIGVDLGYGKKSGSHQLADLNNIDAENLFTFSGKDNVNSTFFSAMLFITYDFIFKG